MKIWILLVNDPGGEAHRIRIAEDKDKGYLQRLSRRILRSNSMHPSSHMLVRGYR